MEDYDKKYAQQKAFESYMVYSCAKDFGYDQDILDEIWAAKKFWDREMQRLPPCDLKDRIRQVIRDFRVADIDN